MQRRNRVKNVAGYSEYSFLVFQYLQNQQHANCWKKFGRPGALLL